jgi:hypothetical protein
MWLYASEKVALTLVEGLTPVAPFCGATAVTLGAVLSAEAVLTAPRGA